MAKSAFVTLSSLDQSTVDYLREARRHRGAGAFQWYVEQVGFPWRIIPLIYGFLALAGAGALMTPYVCDRYDIPLEFRAVLVGLLMGAGGAAWAVGFRNYRGPFLGHFALLDREAVWEVAGAVARISPLARVNQISCQHCVTNDRYLSSSVKFAIDAEERSIRINKRARAEEFAEAIAILSAERREGGSAARHQERRPKSERLTLLLVAGMLALSGLLVPTVWSAWDQQVLYTDGQVGRSPAKLKEYLAFYPKGPFASSADVLRDDLSWDQAHVASVRDDSAAPLRTYLRDFKDGRHVREARANLEEMYKAALDGLRAGKQAKTDVLETMLQRLSESPEPAITIGFAGSHDLPPVPVERPVGDRTVSYIGAFTDRQVREREGAVVRLLREAFGRLVAKNLVEFCAVEPGRAPMMVVRYTVSPSGNSHVLMDTASDREQGVLVGLRVDCQVTIWSGQTIELHSEPAETTIMRMRGHYPDWAPYAIMLHSAFVDLASQLLARMGVPAPSHPELVEFSEG